ncbi:MAG: autotransporter-associated beta strand repeat-containing protein [Chthoniobacter sp.]
MNSAGIIGGWATYGGTNWATVAGGVIAPYSGEDRPAGNGRFRDGQLYLRGGHADHGQPHSQRHPLLDHRPLHRAGNQQPHPFWVDWRHSAADSDRNDLRHDHHDQYRFHQCGAGGELLIYTGAGDALTISAGIGGTVTSFGLTKSGPGTLTLSNAGTTANNFSGGTTINGGILIIDAANRIGTGGVTLNGGQINISFGTSAVFTPNYTLGLNGGTINYTTGGNNTISNTGALTLLGNGSHALTFLGVADRVGTFQETIGDQGGPTSLTFTGAGDTTITSLSGANIYSGPTTINRGVLRMANATALSPNSNLVFNNTTAGQRAILEATASSGTSFTESLGTGPGQVQWVGNGGFSYNGTSGTTYAVNLGGQATPATVQWNTAPLSFLDSPCSSIRSARLPITTFPTERSISKTRSISMARCEPWMSRMAPKSWMPN